jgi:drug/metabolite transporter (DMT)-like permease
MVALAQFIPPPTAHDTPAQVVALYSRHTDRLRAGLVLMMIGAAFFAPWSASISVQLKRIEGRHTPLTYTQLACGAVGVLVILIPVMVMIVASFRPDRHPELTQTLNDLAWIPFIMVFSPVMVQCLAIGIAVFTDAGEDKVMPRWAGYFNVWCAVLLLPAVLIPFFKTGPFAWQGLFEFWLAAVVFFGWVVVMSIVTIGAIKRQPAAAA